MRISNKRKFNKINLCDLMKELGRNFACLEINKAFTTPPHLEISSTQGFEPLRHCERSEAISCKNGFEGCSMNCAIPNSELKINSPRHICESKLGRGDFLVRVGEYLKKSVRAQIEVNPQPSYAHLAWLLPINESSCFASQKHSALWQQSALPSLGEGKTSHADTKGITSADHSCHAELDSASDQRRMDKFSVSRHCERSEAIQENGDLFRLLRRFTPRNDNEKVGVK